MRIVETDPDDLLLDKYIANATLGAHTDPEKLHRGILTLTLALILI